MKESNSTDGNYQFSDYTSIVKAAILTNLSMRPFIYLGGGTQKLNVYEQVISFAEKISAPIGASLTSRPIGAKHSLFFGLIGINGMFEANKALAESDLIFIIGANSCAEIKFASELLKNKKIIYISEKNGKYKQDSDNALSLLGDAKEIISLLSSITLAHCNSNNYWIRDIKNSARVNARQK